MNLKTIFQYQLLFRKCYEEHVPKALKSFDLQEFHSAILSNAHIKKLRSYFDPMVKFTLIWKGSKSNFRAAQFHQHCDNMGPTISVAKTQYDHTFGFYTSVPWQSTGDGKTVQGARSFLFKVLNSKIDGPLR